MPSAELRKLYDNYISPEDTPGTAGKLIRLMWQELNNLESKVANSVNDLKLPEIDTWCRFRITDEKGYIFLITDLVRPQGGRPWFITTNHPDGYELEYRGVNGDRDMITFYSPEEALDSINVWRRRNKK